MPPDAPPPSKAELERLKRERGRFQPKQKPVLRPGGSIGAAIDDASLKRAKNEAHAREKRIDAIEKTIAAKKDAAKVGFSKAKVKGRSREDMRTATADRPKVRSKERAGR